MTGDLILPTVSHWLCVRSNAKGRAVYTYVSIGRAETVLCDPVLVLPAGTPDDILHYAWHWKPAGTFGLALGLSALLNHSSKPNLKPKLRYKDRIIEFYALRDIAPSEELTIDYGPDVWFEEK